MSDTLSYDGAVWVREEQVSRLLKIEREEARINGWKDGAQTAFQYIEQNLWNNSSRTSVVLATRREWNELKKEVLEDHIGESADSTKPSCTSSQPEVQHE